MNGAQDRPVEGQTVGLGNSPFILEFDIAKGVVSGISNLP
jgi:hypothetical protein